METKSSLQQKFTGEEESILTDLRWIRNLLVKIGQEAEDLKIEIDGWLQLLANSEDNFTTGSQLPSLNLLSYAILVDSEVLGDVCNFLLKAKLFVDALGLSIKLFNGNSAYFGPGHLKTIIAHMRVALCEFELNDISKSIESYTEISQKLKVLGLGPNKEFVIMLQCKVEIFFFDQGKFEESLAILQDVYYCRNLFWGSLHKETIIVETQVAFCYLHLKKDSKALKHFNHIHEKLKIVHGEYSEESISMHYELGLTYFNMGNPIDARKTFQEVIVKQILVLPVDSLATLETEVQLALCCNMLQDHAKALTLFQDVHEKRINLLELNHCKTLEVQFHCACTLELQEKYIMAIETYQDLYPRQKEILGELHDDILRTLTRIVTCLGAEKLHDKAFNFYNKILSKQIKKFGSYHEETLKTEFDLAMNMARRGMPPQEVIKTLDKVFETQMAVLGPSHPDFILTGRVLKISKRQFQSLEMGEKIICTICMDEMMFLAAEARIPFECSHIFHENCIAPWTQESNRCPECRSPLNVMSVAMLNKVNI